MDINEYIKQMVREMMDEESTSGDAGAYLTPKAFAKKGQGKNAATKAAEKQGFKVAPEGMPKNSKAFNYKELWKGKKSAMNENMTADDAVQQLRPLLAHTIEHDKLSGDFSEWLSKVKAGDDEILDRMWDLAGNSVDKYAINVLSKLKESDYDKASVSSQPSGYNAASPSSAPSLYLQKSEYTSENMNELEMKKGKRFIPPTFPFNEKLLEPFELSKTKEPVRLFKLVSKGEEYILLASPFVKNALESIERGRGSLEKDRQASFNYTANLANYLKDNLNQMARVAIKKYLQNAKPGPGGYFPINLTVTKGKNGELLIKNPVFDTSSDIASPKYESIQNIIDQELINEATYSKFKKDISYRSKTEMLHKGIKEVKRKLAEIDRIVEYTSRMKQELSEGEEGIKYWKATVNNVTQISEMINNLNEKIKNLYQ
jgi:hypothetical protein